SIAFDETDPLECVWGRAVLYLKSIPIKKDHDLCNDEYQA
ncbi:hypothetical protein HHE02_02790, partial [Helicobacter heilmannii]